MAAKYTDKEIEDFLRAANWDLGSGKYKSKDLIQDYARSVIIGKQLLKENRQLKELIDIM